MARYYEENALIEFVKQYTPTIEGETTLECVERAIRNAPTADVVPKSEVDLYKRLNDELEDELASAYDKLKKAKSEVAREIFEEIESISSDFPLYGNINTVILSERDLAFIKKKYTQEK